MTNRKNDIIQEAIKKAKKESVMGKLGDSPYEDPMEPWSGKYQSPVKEELIVEVNTMILFRYIKALGYNPEFMTFAQRSSYARSNAFKRWKEEHKEDQLPTQEEFENLDEAEVDEMAGANMDTRAVHQHLKKSGWKLTRSSGGHDVFTHPESDKSIPVPRHKQLKAPLVLSIMKTSKIAAKELDEAGTGLLMSYIKAKGLNPLSMDGNQKSAYSRSSEFQQYKSKRVSESLGELKELYGMKGLSDLIINQQEISEISGMGERGDDWNESAGAKLSMPLKGHPYHKKSDAELRYIQKDAAEAAKAMQGHAPKSEAKYLDQVNDASTVLYYRGKGGKQLAKEEVEELDELSKGTLLSYVKKADKQQGKNFDDIVAAHKDNNQPKATKANAKYINRERGQDRAVSKMYAKYDKPKTEEVGIDEAAKWRQGYSASGHPAGYKHKSGETGPLGGTYTNEPSGYDGDTSKSPVNKYRDAADPLASRDKTKLSTTGKKLLARNAMSNLKAAITRSKGTHGPVSKLPEEVEESSEWGNYTVHTSTGKHVVYGPGTDHEEMRKHLHRQMGGHGKITYGDIKKIEPNTDSVPPTRDVKSNRSYNESVKLKEETDKKDTVTLDIPLMIRVLEYAREDAKTDMDLHKVVENLINLRGEGPLSMNHYAAIVNIKGTVKEENLTEFKKQPDNMDADDHITREGIYGIEDSPMSATNSVKAMENSARNKKMSRSASLIKSIYKKNGVSESMYDWEKEDKGAKGKEVTAKITLTGGKTMTGKDRDTVEIEPVMKTKTKNTAGMKTGD